MHLIKLAVQMALAGLVLILVGVLALLYGLIWLAEFLGFNMEWVKIMLLGWGWI